MLLFEGIVNTKYDRIALGCCYDFGRPFESDLTGIYKLADQNHSIREPSIA